jgi:hypothetical protein
MLSAFSMQLIKGASAAAALAVVLSARPAVIAQTGQATDPKTGVIAGRVLDGVSKSPLDDAVVTISGPGEDQRRVMVDGSGRFAFWGLAAGTYRIESDRLGFAPSGYGRSHPTAALRAIDLSQRQARTDADIFMWQLSAITGQLVDEAGESIVRAEVTAYQRRFERGAPRLFRADARSSLTDDRGRFRISGLMPGVYTIFVPNPVTTLPVAWLADYFNAPGSGLSAAGVTNELSRPEGARNSRVGDVVVASRSYTAPLVEPPSLGSMLAFRPTFFGGPDIEAAEFISIGAGEERGGIRVQVPLARGLRLAGRVVSPDGNPISGLAVRLFSVSSTVWPDDPDLAMATTLTDESGRFTLLGVPRGNYLLRGGYIESEGVISRTGLPWWVEARVSQTDRENDTLLIQAQPLPSIHGRFVGVTSSDANPEIVLWNVGASMGRVVRPVVDKSMRFSARLMPGVYTVAPSIRTKSCDVRLGARDVGDEPIDIRGEVREELVIDCAPPAARLAGTVRLPSGRLDPDAVVVVFPTDSRHWAGATVRMLRLRDARTGSDGAFSIDLSPGEYFVAAIAGDSAGDWKDPAMLTRLAGRARRVRLGTGAAQSVDLVRTAIK